MCGKLLRMIDVHAPATRACHEPLRDRKLYITEKITIIRGSGLNFYGLRDDVMCILLVFGLQRAILKIFGGILWGHSLRSGEMQYKALLKTTG